MAKRATVSPRWLDSMLYKWGERGARQEDGGLGYASVCPYLASGIPVRARSFEPMGVADYELEELDQHISGLEKKYQLVLIRNFRSHYRFDAERLLMVYSHSDRTWRQWLHDAAALLEPLMKRQNVLPINADGCRFG